MAVPNGACGMPTKAASAICSGTQKTRSWLAAVLGTFGRPVRIEALVAVPNGACGMLTKAASSEHDLFGYPGDSKLVGDGIGGFWVLCSTRRAGGDSEWRLWHGTKSGERDLFGYPKKIKVGWPPCRRSVGTLPYWLLEQAVANLAAVACY